MFKMVAGNNGRTVYFGKILKREGNELEVQGIEWNKNDKKEEVKYMHLTIDSEIEDRTSDIKAGDSIIFTVLPSRKDPMKGVAEEIGWKNNAIQITNENGKEKLAIIAEVKTKKWNEKHNCLNVSFKNVSDIDRNMVGYKQSYTQYGVDWITAYLNVSFFNNSDNKSQNADNVDKRMKIGDTVVMVVSVKESFYEGKNYMNYYGGKYEIVN